jgi:hypothetical protein
MITMLALETNVIPTQDAFTVPLTVTIITSVP